MEGVHANNVHMMVEDLNSISTDNDAFLIANTIVIALLAISIAWGYFTRSGKLKESKTTMREVIGWLVMFITIQIVIDSISWYTDESMADGHTRMLFSTMEFIFSYVCYLVYTECVMYVAKTEKTYANISRVFSFLACVGMWGAIYHGKLFHYRWGYFVLEKTYWWALIYPLGIMLFNTYQLCTSKIIDKRNRNFLLLFGWLPTIGVFVKMIFNDNFFARIANIIILLALYINIIMMSVRHQEAVEKELVETKMNTMVSQIRPHFIFNSLSSIIDLCPEHSEAQEALIQFAKYLRVNIDALSYSHPRLFKEELQHVKAYLTLEKYNYGERLQIDYDIQAEHFTLPVLSLQPLVENAVKYGFVKKKQVHVLIKTIETDDAYKIIVEDNGGGFDEAAVRMDDKRHTGIDNVKYRLKEMVDGSLEYEDIEDGTRAILTIPKTEDEEI